jgi:hypothetical protein
VTEAVAAGVLAQPAEPVEQASIEHASKILDTCGSGHLGRHVPTGRSRGAEVSPMRSERRGQVGGVATCCDVCGFWWLASFCLVSIVIVSTDMHRCLCSPPATCVWSPATAPAVPSCHPSRRHSYSYHHTTHPNHLVALSFSHPPTPLSLSLSLSHSPHRHLPR